MKLNSPLVCLEPTTFELEVQHASPLRYRGIWQNVFDTRIDLMRERNLPPQERSELYAVWSESSKDLEVFSAGLFSRAFAFSVRQQFNS